MIKKRELETFITNRQNQKAEENKRNRRTANEAKERYKTRECASLQVFLQEDLVNAFKALVRENGHTQAGVIRGLVRSYLSTAGTADTNKTERGIKP